MDKYDICNDGNDIVNFLSTIKIISMGNNTLNYKPKPENYLIPNKIKINNHEYIDSNYGGLGYGDDLEYGKDNNEKNSELSMVKKCNFNEEKNKFFCFRLLDTDFNNPKLLRFNYAPMGASGIVYSYLFIDKQNHHHNFAIKVPINDISIDSVRNDYDNNNNLPKECKNFFVRGISQTVNNKYFCLIMDKMDGELNNDKFTKYINNSKYIAYTIINILNQIYDGLNCICANDYVYTDMKPENILIKHNTECINVKIGDIGSIHKLNTEIIEGFTYFPYYSNNVTKNAHKNFTADTKFMTYQFGVIVFYLLITVPSNIYPPHKPEHIIKYTKTMEALKNKLKNNDAFLLLYNTLNYLDYIQDIFNKDFKKQFYIDEGSLNEFRLYTGYFQ